MSKVIFSGIQPSGNLHIGNYIGAIKQWIDLQNSSKFKVQSSKLDENELIFCIVDLHAITVYQDPKVLKEKILETAALYLSCGIDPKIAKIFIQSENPDHTYLTWILDCVTPFGLLSRMTQFKDKSSTLLRRAAGIASSDARQGFEGRGKDENITVGLFNYPALMAADILLYDTDQVPVGEDQKQHIEFTRDIGEKFNKMYGQVFKLPEPLIQKETARIMSLQNPLSKMSKSDSNPLGAINLLDNNDLIVEKVKKAVTDSGSEIIAREDKPAMSNILTIFESVSGISVFELEQKYKNAKYSDFKNDLAEAVVEFLAPVQKKYTEIREDKNYLNMVLDEGRDYAVAKSSKKVQQVKEIMGLGR